MKYANNWLQEKTIVSLKVLYRVHSATDENQSMVIY